MGRRFAYNSRMYFYPKTTIIGVAILAAILIAYISYSITGILVDCTLAGIAFFFYDRASFYHFIASDASYRLKWLSEHMTKETIEQIDKVFRDEHGLWTLNASLTYPYDGPCSHRPFPT